MLVDLEAGRPMEIEGIVGGVVRKGREAGFHAPRRVQNFFLEYWCRLILFQVGIGICNTVNHPGTASTQVVQRIINEVCRMEMTML